MGKYSGCGRTLLRILAIILVVLLVGVLPTSILANNVLNIVFSTENVTKIVSELLILRGGMRDQLVVQTLNSEWFSELSEDYAGAFSYITPRDEQIIAKILFPDEWIESQTRNFVTDLMIWIESDVPMPKITLDLLLLRQHLESGGIKRFVEFIVDTWPECTAPQANRLERGLNQAPSSLTEFCKPEGDLKIRLVEITTASLINQLHDFPSEIPLDEGLETQNSAAQLKEFRENVLVMMLLMRWIRIIPFLFLGLLMVLMVRSWRELGLWWGVPLIIGAVFILVLNVLSFAIAPARLRDILVQTEVVPEVREALFSAFWPAVDSVLKRSLLHGFIILVIGIALLIVTLTTKAKPSPSIQTETSPSTTDETSDPIFSPPPVSPFKPEEISPEPEPDSEDDTPSGMFG